LHLWSEITTVQQQEFEPLDPWLVGRDVVTPSYSAISIVGYFRWDLALLGVNAWPGGYDVDSALLEVCCCGPGYAAVSGSWAWVLISDGQK